jgi:hypothetical protein
MYTLRHHKYDVEVKRVKNIQQTATELVIKNQLDVPRLISSFMVGTFFMGIPVLMTLGILSQITITTLKCKRLEPTLINCEKQESYLFGLAEQPPIKFSQVKSAKFKSKEGIDSEGNRTIDNWVTLVTSSGEETFVEDFITVNGVRGSASEMQEIATQINNFIQSNQASLQIQQDLPEDFVQIIPILGFMSIFFFVGAAVIFTEFRSEKLILDKKSGQLILEQKTLLDKKYEYYPLNEIQGVDIKEEYYGKAGKFYELRLIPKKTLKLIPENIYKAIRLSDKKLLCIKNLRATIYEFLAIPLPKTFPYFFLRALFVEKLIAEENATTLLFAVVYAISIKRLPK